MRWNRRALAAAFALTCLLAASGCEFKAVKVQLPTFFSAGVEEVWFWRLDETTRGYVRSGHIELLGLYGPAGSQKVKYTIIGPEGAELYTLEAPVALSGDSITFNMNYARVAKPGWFRLSARNAGGESALSSREVYL